MFPLIKKAFGLQNSMLLYFKQINESFEVIFPMVLFFSSVYLALHLLNSLHCAFFGYDGYDDIFGHHIHYLRVNQYIYNIGKNIIQNLKSFIHK